MEKKKLILYISNNDGSDTRINKEIKTLSKEFTIIFLGVGLSDKHLFFNGLCKKIILIKGKRNHPITILKLITYCINVLLKFKIKSIHIINEQLMIFFWPILFCKHTVVDVFDSIFLKMGIKNNEQLFFRRLLFLPINKIIVTDENRKELMPNFLQKKIMVIENYPSMLKNECTKRQQNELTILFFGWLGMKRGGEFIKAILESNRFPDITVIMAGWFSDQETKELINHEKVEYRGVVPQAEALKIACHEADYILCLYAPINDNNINASPNKIYDAIQTNTPLIINQEIKVSEFVKQNEIGIVLNEYLPPNVDEVIKNLIDKKGTFIFDSRLKKKYSWESIEDKLIKAHNTF
jgi:hypothetical protein